MMEYNLEGHISFEKCKESFTAMDVFNLLKDSIPGITVGAIDRYLSHYANGKYATKEGVRYWCRVIK